MENEYMDMDMDIDLGPIGSEVAYSNDHDKLLFLQNQSNGSDTTSNTAEAPHKIHIRGVDDLTTNDIKAFSAEHHPAEAPLRVEWVDDTSANIVFDGPATALKALEDFTLASEGLEISSIPALQLRDAKALSTHAGSKLQVRTALSMDQKRPRAYEASRFYLLHPEHDPREQRCWGVRRQQHSNGDYRRRRYSNDEQQRRRYRDDEEGFDPFKNDDNKSSSRHDSMDLSAGERVYDDRHSQLRGDSYRPARDRSASPDGQGNGISTRRRRTPPPSYRSRDPHPFPTGNKDKELFPSKSATARGLDSKEGKLFSNRVLAAGLKKELFPQKANTINHHRRSDAFDAADETADLFSNGLLVPFADGPQAGRSLADRITNGSTTSSYGRLKGSDSEPRIETQGSDDTGLSIRGASGHQDEGFTIRGGAAAAGTIKELFPGKAVGNGRKELFTEKLKGRRRNRAEDMFH